MFTTVLSGALRQMHTKELISGLFLQRYNYVKWNCAQEISVAIVCSIFIIVLDVKPDLIVNNAMEYELVFIMYNPLLCPVLLCQTTSRGDWEVGWGRRFTV